MLFYAAVQRVLRRYSVHVHGLILCVICIVQEPIRHGIWTLLRWDSGPLIQEQGWRVSGANGQVRGLGFKRGLQRDVVYLC